jgi:hypothetical protein
MGNWLDFSAGKTHFKFVPSRARYYIRCPYFLYLSNNKEIYIPYSQIASQKGNFFEKLTLNRISEKTGYEISKANQVTDLLRASGLYTLNKQVDTEFYVTGNVVFKVGMLKPDLILSEKAQNSIEITIIEIKHSDDLKVYHYLQAFIYKLTLEKLLSDRIRMPIHIRVRMIHREKGCYPQEEYESDFGIFRKNLLMMDFESLIVENSIDIESEIILNQVLQDIASLQANTAECDACPGAGQCEHS